MVAATGIDHCRTAHALAGAVVTGAGFHADAGNELRLRQQHIDRAAQRPGTVQHRSATLDHLKTLGHAEAHEGSDGAGRLRRVEAHAIDQQHDALLAKAPDDRILALGAVVRDGNAGLAAQRLADIGRTAAENFVAIKRYGGQRRFKIAGGITLGGDVDRRQGVLLRLGGREGEKQGKCDRSQTRQGHGSSGKWGWLANGWLA